MTERPSPSFFQGWLVISRKSLRVEIEYQQGKLEERIKSEFESCSVTDHDVSNATKYKYPAALREQLRFDQFDSGRSRIVSPSVIAYQIA
jgi:hypothetical protein